MEEWRDIEGFEGLYQVSNEGQVRSLDRIAGKRKHRGVVLKPSASSGYMVVILGKDRESKPIHRLVAKAFVPNPDEKQCVNHIDGNKLNNVASNLEWCTYSDNMNHAMRTGLRNDMKSVVMVKDGVPIKTFPSIMDAHRETGADFRMISACCRGKRNKTGGYQWRFANEK